jgi:hypothetical protein
MTAISTTETPQEALQRIQSMQMCQNDVIVIQAFADAGIPAEDITPRLNVLTFKAWKAAGRQVAKGAKSLGITVWIPMKGKKSAGAASENGGDGKKPRGGMRPKLTRLFHECQTIPIDAPKGTKPEAWENPALVREGTYEPDEPTEQPEASESNECNCPMVGVMENVDCPIHGEGV